LAARNFGLDFSVFGAGGGLAATCGADATGNNEGEDGMITGGESASGGGWVFPLDRRADIIARL
jgi:hypothetical protein